MPDGRPEERNELHELQKEWRSEIVSAIREIRQQNQEIAQELHALRQDFATVSAMKDAESRITALETERAKILGGLVALQLIGTVALWIINRFFQKP